MLPILLNVPWSVDDWNIFSFHHRTSHDLIVQGIFRQTGQTLPGYVIDPIPAQAPQQWLEANQSYHTDMNGALGLQGSDIEDVKLDDPHQLQAWIWLHYLEHQSAELQLGIAS